MHPLKERRDWYSVRNMLWAISCALLLGGVLAGCARKVETSGMSEEEFVRFFVEVALATERYAASPDSLKAAHSAVFREHGVSREDVRRTIEHLRENPERWLEVMKRIQEVLRKRRCQVGWVVSVLSRT